MIYSACKKAASRSGAVKEKGVGFKIRHKFNAIQTVTDGIKFGSKKEAAYYAQLKLRQMSGEVLFFLRQVPFHLPGGVRCVVDFMEFNADGSVRIVEVKGKDLAMGKLKRKQVEALYPITIDVV